MWGRLQGESKKKKRYNHLLSARLNNPLRVRNGNANPLSREENGTTDEFSYCFETFRNLPFNFSSNTCRLREYTHARARTNAHAKL